MQGETVCSTGPPFGISVEAEIGAMPNNMAGCANGKEKKDLSYMEAYFTEVRRKLPCLQNGRAWMHWPFLLGQSMAAMKGNLIWILAG